VKRYEVNGWYASFAVDDYENGEQDEGYSTDGGERWHADTLPDLVEQVMSFAGTDDMDAVAIFREDDGQGRIDIQRLEDENHDTPTEAEMTLWRAGKKKLWAAYYIFQVERVTRHILTADELRAALPQLQEA
jgi:hypothetical protein